MVWVRVRGWVIHCVYIRSSQIEVCVSDRIAVSKTQGQCAVDANNRPLETYKDIQIKLLSLHRQSTCLRSPSPPFYLSLCLNQQL